MPKQPEIASLFQDFAPRQASPLLFYRHPATRSIKCLGQT
jgi:hypothetical protein